MLDLLNENKKFPTRKEFRDSALKIDSDYNKNWINTEYDFTVAKANSAVQWKDYETRKHLYPNLRYIAVHDGRSRAGHLKFDGLILPMDHPFWKTHLGPWDYGCRCGVDQTDDDEDALGLNLDNIKPTPGAGTNPGISGKVFADDHPVYNVPPAEKKEVLANLNDIKANKFTPPNLAEYEKKLGVEINKDMFSLLQKETPLYFENPPRYEEYKGAYYASRDNFVKIPIDQRRKNSKWYASAVVHHEYGHAIDWQLDLKNSPRLTKLFKSSQKLYTRQEYKDAYMNIWRERYLSANASQFDREEKFGAILDTIASLHNGINNALTHKKSYWKLAGKSEAEFIAHLFENKFLGNDEFEKFLPKLYNAMKEFELLD